MIGTFVETLFIRVYTLLKLNLIFVICTGIGGLILGIGPAVLVVTKLFFEAGWHPELITYQKTKEVFKVSFKRGNFLFYGYGVVFGMLTYNLYLALQLMYTWAFVLSFILIFVSVCCIINYVYAILLESKYEMALKHLIKLAFILFFIKGKITLVLIFWTALVGGLHFYYPVLTLVFVSLLVSGWVGLSKTTIVDIEEILE